MGAMMESDMRAELFDHYQKLSFRFYDEQKTGQLMSRITNDLLSLTELYHHGPEDYLIYLVRFIGAFVILPPSTCQLTLAVFLFLPFMAGCLPTTSTKMHAALKRNKERIGDVNAQVEDNLSGIRVVKSFANEEIEKKNSPTKTTASWKAANIYKNEASCIRALAFHPADHGDGDSSLAGPAFSTPRWTWPT
jgi:ATP-binding cassette, subfamily B, bacterial